MGGEEMKRPRAPPPTEDSFHFSLSNGHEFRVERLNKPATHSDFDDVDSMLFAVYFRPALTQKQASSGILRISYVGEKEIQAAESLVFSQYVWPDLTQQKPHWMTLRSDELEYVCFETHQLRMGVTKNTIAALYVIIENTQCESNGPLCLTPQVDMHHTFMPSQLPTSQFLCWFPPDVNPSQWGLQIDATKIPQRTPLWEKLRAEFTGSMASKRLGFFPDDNRQMSAFIKSAMRLGSLSEDLILLAYLGHYKGRRFEEIGTAAIRGHPGWGASPDGIVYDESGDRGVCEFKTSRTKLGMEAYFYPQLYMEMMAVGVQWANLVRYRPSKTWNAHSATWSYTDVCYVYRVQRDPLLEAELIQLWSKSPVPSPDALAAMRSRLMEMAANAQPISIIDASNSPLLSAYREHRKRQCELVKMPATASVSADWLAVEARTAELAAQIRSGVAVDKRLVAKQIKAYASFL